jgi:phage tail sheath gpL-like
MTVPFARVPDNLRVGLFFVEFDNSMANNATATQRTLLIGGMLSTGSTPRYSAASFLFGYRR